MIEAKEIEKLVEEKIAGTTCFVVEIKTGASKVLVSVDKPEGITIEECAQISRHIRNNYSNPEELENYDMEVSSPGMDQPLKVYPQYLRRIGRALKITTTEGKEITGILKSVTNEKLVLEETILSKEKNKKITATTVKDYPFTDIKETRVVISFK